ncbi:MAG TPA: UrcA family protein [Alphaproteobacteria bacterium]|jgi:UrcA family protein|nr:UrcA family protein [Alphaproteobacteria bacterium]
MSRVLTLSRSLPALAILAAATLAAPAFAGESDVPTKVVHFRDLDLATTEGEAALTRRIAKAADDVCWRADGPTLTDHERYAACRSTAIASAQPKLNAVIASARSDHRYAMNGTAIAMLAR